MSKSDKIPFSIKLVIGFHILNIVLWSVGQGGTIIDYDTIAEWGFQEPRELIDPVMVEVNRGTGLADVIIMLPLFIIALIGLLRMKFYGAVTSWMALGITIYWPLVACWQNYYYKLAGLKSPPFSAGILILLAFFCLFSVWASWILLRNRKLFA